MRDLTMENPIRAIRTMSHDPTRSRHRAARQRTRAVGPGHAARVPRQGRRVRRPRGHGQPGHEAGHRPLGPGPRRHRVGRPRRHRHRDRLGHQAPPHRALPRPSTDSPSPTPGSSRSTSPTTTSTAGAGCSTCSSGTVERPASPPTSRSSRRRSARRRRREPSCAATSSGPPRRTAATSPSTGCTSSSTTRPSAPCCARTRSGPWTSGSSASWRRSTGPRPSSARSDRATRLRRVTEHPGAGVTARRSHLSARCASRTRVGVTVAGICPAGPPRPPAPTESLPLCVPTAQPLARPLS